MVANTKKPDKTQHKTISWITFYLVSVYFVKHHRVINVKEDLLGGLKSRGDEIERVGVMRYLLTWK